MEQAMSNDLTRRLKDQNRKSIPRVSMPGPQSPAGIPRQSDIERGGLSPWDAVQDLGRSFGYRVPQLGDAINSLWNSSFTPGGGVQYPNPPAPQIPGTTVGPYRAPGQLPKMGPPPFDVSGIPAMPRIPIGGPGFDTSQIPAFPRIPMGDAASLPPIPGALQNPPPPMPSGPMPFGPSPAGIMAATDQGKMPSEQNFPNTNTGPLGPAGSMMTGGVDFGWGQSMIDAQREPSAAAQGWAQNVADSAERLAPYRTGTHLDFPTDTTRSQAILGGMPEPWAVDRLNAEVTDRINAMVDSLPHNVRQRQMDQYSADLNSRMPEGQMALEDFVDMGRDIQGRGPKARPLGYENTGSTVERTVGPGGQVSWVLRGPTESTPPFPKDSEMSTPALPQRGVNPGASYQMPEGPGAMFSVAPERTRTPGPSLHNTLSDLEFGISVPNMFGEDMPGLPPVQQTEPPEFGVTDGPYQDAPEFEMPAGTPGVRASDIRNDIRQLGKSRASTGESQNQMLRKYLSGEYSGAELDPELRQLASDIERFNVQRGEDFFNNSNIQNIAQRYSALSPGWTTRAQDARNRLGPVNVIRAAPPHQRAELLRRMLLNPDLQAMSFAPERGY